ncbi:hypothetical protein CIPAW_07G149400 [Carya illinoinensis]|uniref:Uncharacterized protein n=1 Tax=Carya illinoinensis TaxID=32201 RepID=A0A8T1Q375_CARIL|nr:hypothetical protein CIPAW_07G149400 [Carya illinoinensis]
MMDASAPCSEFTTGETEVADILLHLPQLVLESESRCRFWSWSAKRRRSSGRPVQSFVCFPLGSSSPSELRGGTDVGGVGPVCEREGAPAVKAEATSPATPLLFSPGSESDEKPKQLSKRKPPLKRKREDWLEIIDELNRRRDSLKGEIEYMRSYCTYLRASNLEMKAKAVPSGLPDLNVSAESMDFSGLFDLNVNNQSMSRVIAAQARQRRMQIYKAKKLNCR